jgi:hypothetical protein
MLSCLACATSFVFAYLFFAPRLPMSALDIRSPRSYADFECVSSEYADSVWRFRVRNNTARSVRLSDEREFSIMVRTPEGLEPAASDVRIDVPVDMPAGETALLTLHAAAGERFLVMAPGQGVRFELGP